MRSLVAWVLELGLAANGLAMLEVPANWYAMVPGVVDTGPFNVHFVRDIGIAYVVAGAALVWFAKAAYGAVGGAGWRVVPGAPRGGPPLGGRDRGRARAPIVGRRPHRLFAAGSGALDRLVAIVPRHKAKEGEER